MGGRIPITNWRENVNRVALLALKADWAEKKPGYCSKFVRQIFEKALGFRPSMFGTSAIATERMWAKAMKTVPTKAPLQKGDVLFQGVGSNGFGHVGIVVEVYGKLVVAENSYRDGENPDCRLLTPLSKFGQITSVGVYAK